MFKGRWWDRLGWLAGAITWIAGWAAIFWPPIREYGKCVAISDPALAHRLNAVAAGQAGELPKVCTHDAVDTFIALLQIPTPIYPDVPIGGYLFLAASVIPLVVLGIWVRQAIEYWDNARVPLSVLETDVTLSFAEPDMKRAILTRKQFFHANQPDVGAYHSTTKVDGEKASIDPNHQVFDAQVGHRSIKGEIIKQGNEKSINVIEIYNESLPRNPLVTILPNQVVHSIYKNFGAFFNVIVKRTTVIHLVDEYNAKEPFYSISSMRYPVTNVKLRFLFHSETAPSPEDISAFLIKDNLAMRLALPPCHEGAFTTYEVAVREFKSATIRVAWNNRNLFAWKERQPTADKPSQPQAPTAEKPAKK